MNARMRCPLCDGSEIMPYHRDQRRPYQRCERCALVFVAPANHLSPEAERAEYDLHENVVEDPGYRRFLSRLAQPLTTRLQPGASGLDFGCGPGPALAAMLEEAGFTMRLYDQFYATDEQALSGQYDFICATEVVEHLRQPGAELARLWSLLAPGGWLGIMTKLVQDPVAFAHWHYKNDPTHICFYSRDTWQWWAQQCGASLEIIGADVILLGRQSS